MKRTLLFSLILQCLLLLANGQLAFAVPCPTSEAPLGSGTELDPYLIASFENLLWISENNASWDSWFMQTADIDASITSSGCVNAAEGWSPIGNVATPFTGAYDGNGHTVSALYISRSTAAIGLFGQVTGGALTDLTVQGTVTGNGDVGLLVGQLTGSEADPAYMSGCHSSGVVTSIGARIGGLLGYALQACLIEDCSSSASVTGATRVGGVIGQAWNNINTSSWIDNQNFMISTCFGTGSSEATASANLLGVAGGFIGFVNNYNIQDSYTSASVAGPGNAIGWATGTQPVGAFAGRLNNIGLGAIRRCYASGAVSYTAETSPTANGFIGSPATSCTNCSNNLFDSETTAQTSGVGATAKTTVEMNTLATFTGEGWDFQCEDANGTAQLWGITGADNNAYPFLSNQRYFMADCPQWSGTSSTQWNTSTNWSDGNVPDETDDIYISRYTLNDPHVTNDPSTPAECAALTIGRGATLTIDAGKALAIGGDLSNAGTMLVDANTNGIGSLITLGSVSGSGSFQMEQSLIGGGGSTPSLCFYYVSSPVVGATSLSFDAAGDNKLWSASESAQGYTEITDNTTTLNVGQGYVARLGAPDGEAFTGSTFNTGSVSISGLTRTGTSALNRGYNLVGNPYPSCVNWNTASKTNLETTIWFRTHDMSFVMVTDTYNTTGDIGTNNNGNGDVTNIIPPTQGFWVRVNADGQTGQLDFDNADRSHQAWASIYRQAAEEGTVRLALSDGEVSDETIIYFNMDALDSFDDFDSHKMWMDNIPQLYTTTGEDSLTINGLFSIETNPIVDLGIKAPTTGNYTITASSITLTEEVWLEDRLLNNFQHLNVNPAYAFTTDQGNIGDRFALHFGMMAVGIGRDAINGVSTHVFAADGMVNVSVGNDITTGMITILDMAGRTVQSAAISGSRTVVATDLVTGIYLVRVETEKGGETHRVVVR